MQFSEISEKGRVLQSQLLLQLDGIEHYSTLKETRNADINVWMPKQVHGIDIVELSEANISTQNNIAADAVVCNVPNQWIGVRTADCVPVLLYDPEKGIIAAIHAGWRGTVKHIARLTVEKIIESYSCQASSIYAMIGPSISPESFEVGKEVAEEFQKAGRTECIVINHSAEAQNSKPHIDLWQSNVMDLLEAGLELDHIDCTPICTLQNSDILFSARKEGIDTGRIITAIKLI